MNKSVFVIVPVYNEEASIREVILSLLSHGCTPVIINDGSTDRSAAIIQALPVHYLEHMPNLGQGAAIQTGISYALLKGASYLVTFDADGQHDASDISALLQPLLSGQADLTFGSRFMDGSVSNIMSSRKVAVRMARWLNYFLSGLLLSDAHNGLRAMNRVAAEKIFLTEPGMAHATEIHIQAAEQKLRVKEVPVSVRYTAYSRSKGQSGWNGIRILFDLIVHKISK